MAEGAERSAIYHRVAVFLIISIPQVSLTLYSMSYQSADCQIDHKFFYY